MNCPGCATEMTRLTLEARLGTTLEIDMCSLCRAIWFDRFEDLTRKLVNTPKPKREN